MSKEGSLKMKRSLDFVWAAALLLIYCTPITTCQMASYVRAFNSSGPCSGVQMCTEDDCIFDGRMLPSLFHGDLATCDCHINCLLHGTCCLNFEMVCLSRDRLHWLQTARPYFMDWHSFGEIIHSMNTSLDQIERLMNMRRAAIITEQVFVKDMDSDVDIVSRCPACGLKMKCLELKSKCESRRFTDLIQTIPVQVNGIVFKNKYCALCYEAATSEEMSTSGPSHFTEMEALIDCTEFFAREAFSYFERNDHSGILSMINANACRIEYDHTIYGNLTVPRLVSTCEKPYEGEIEHFNQLSEACLSYAAYGVSLSKIRPKLYRNRHCALCDGMKEDDLNEGYTECVCPLLASASRNGSTCASINNGRFTTLFVPFFSIALDLSGSVLINSISTRICDGDWQVADYNSGRCIDLTCPRLYVNLDCTCIHTSHVHVYTLTSPENLEISVSLRPMISDADVYSDIVSEFSTTFLKVFDLSSDAFPNWQSRGELQRYPMSPDDQADKVYLNLSIEGNSRRLFLGSIANYLFTDTGKTMRKFEETLPLDSLMLQANHRMECPGDYNFMELTQPLFLWTWDVRSDTRKKIRESEPYALFADSNIILDPNLHKWTIRVSKVSKTWSASFSLLFCSSRDTECEAVNGTVSNATCTILAPRSAAAEAKQVEGAHSNDAPGNNSWDSLMTIVLSVISILSLCVSLVIHQVYPNIMKRGGRLFKHLLLSILGAELCVLASGFPQVWSHIACSIVAALTHYFWLCSFVWTAIMSWDIFVVFCLPMKTMCGSLISHYIIHLIVGWIFPLLIVGLCGILNYFEYFTYGSQVTCWINGGIQLGLSFGLPIAAIIAFNLVLYGFIVSQLNRDMNSAQEAGRAYDPKVRFILCCKMSSIVGFTWIFGFLANVPYLSFFRYAFSVCAGLNGTLVAYSFTISSRSLKVLRSSLSVIGSLRSSKSQPRVEQET